VIKDPHVSVILPTYNRADVLGRSIQSVLSQSFTDFELVIVDDASRDDTASVVKSFDDTRIRYVQNEENLGGAEARNVGIRHAQAQLIAFQDSDDEWRPIKLERCIRELSRDNSLIGVYSAYWQINDKNVRYMPMTPPPSLNGNIHQALLWRSFMGTPTAVVYKKYINACGGFDRTMPRFQDWDLFIRLSHLGKFLFIDDPLILSFCTSDSISTNNLARLQAFERIYAKNKDKIHNDKKLHASWKARIGDAQMRSGSPLKGRSNLLCSVRLCPVNTRYITKMMISIFKNRGIYIYMNNFFEKNFSK
jgi:glycosyltransferase involved in cell wall biosynthesis